MVVVVGMVLLQLLRLLLLLPLLLLLLPPPSPTPMWFGMRVSGFGCWGTSNPPHPQPLMTAMGLSLIALAEMPAA